MNPASNQSTACLNALVTDLILKQEVTKLSELFSLLTVRNMSIVKEIVIEWGRWPPFPVSPWENEAHLLFSTHDSTNQLSYCSATVLLSVHLSQHHSDMDTRYQFHNFLRLFMCSRSNAQIITREISFTDNYTFQLNNGSNDNCHHSGGL